MGRWSARQGDPGLPGPVAAAGAASAAQPGPALFHVDVTTAGGLHGGADRDPGEKETVRVHLQSRRDRPESAPTHDQQPRSGLCGKKKTIEVARDELKAGDVFSYADEFNLSWFPTLRAMWSPKGQQVMIPTPAQPTKHYGIGAVNYHTGKPWSCEAAQTPPGDR